MNISVGFWHSELSFQCSCSLVDRAGFIMQAYSLFYRQTFGVCLSVNFVKYEEASAFPTPMVR